MLNQLANQIHQTSKSKGFWESVRPVSEVLLLVTSEVVEAFEAYREHRDVGAHRYGTDGKPEGVPSELADIVIRTLDICAAWGIDIDVAVQEKMQYNEGRPYKHGKEF